MRNVPTALLPLVCLLSLAGCDQRSVPSSAKSATGEDPLVQDVKQLEYGVRLSVANKRIQELERKVGALEATPEKMDLDLLTQRVMTLEVKSAGDEASISTIAPTSNIPQPVGSAPQTGSGVRRSPVARSKLTLPELENRPRLATPVEAKAFSPGK